MTRTGACRWQLPDFNGTIVTEVQAGELLDVSWCVPECARCWACVSGCYGIHSLRSYHIFGLAWQTVYEEPVIEPCYLLGWFSGACTAPKDLAESERSCRDLHYAHQGGFRIELYDANATLINRWNSSDHWGCAVDSTVQNVTIRLPNQPCEGCILRFERQVWIPPFLQPAPQHQKLMYLPVPCPSNVDISHLALLLFEESKAISLLPCGLCIPLHRAHVRGDQLQPILQTVNDSSQHLYTLVYMSLSAIVRQRAPQETAPAPLQALEWGATYLFKSCAILDITSTPNACQGCSGHGTCGAAGSCQCDSSEDTGFFYGAHCEFENECETDDHCGSNGKCLDTGDESGPAKQVCTPPPLPSLARCGCPWIHWVPLGITEAACAAGAVVAVCLWPDL